MASSQHVSIVSLVSLLLLAGSEAVSENALAAPVAGCNWNLTSLCSDAEVKVSVWMN